MSKEEFLYNFLVKYNIKEKAVINRYSTNNNDSWIKNDKDNEQDGLLLYILRNLLAHDTEETLNSLSDEFEYDSVIAWLDNMCLDKIEKLKLLEYLLKSSKVENELYSKNFKKFQNNNKKNIYYCYYRKLDGIYFNIFLHPDGQFITCDISTFNHSKITGGREYYECTDIYVESELYGDMIILRLIKGDDLLSPKLELYFKKNGKNFDNAIIQVGYSKMSGDKYVENRFVKNRDHSCENTSFLCYIDDLEKAKASFKDDFNFELLHEISNNVSKQYKEINQVLQKVGIQL